jgi:hypothetical protein
MMHPIRRLTVTVNFSRESPRRSGWVDYDVQGDTVVIRQSLERTEQWENDAVSTVYIPRRIMEYIANDPDVKTP